MAMHVKDAGLWKPVTLHVKNAGSWLPVQTGYVKDGGLWKPFYTASAVVDVVAPTTLSAQNVATIFENAETGLWTSTKSKRLIVSSSIGPLVINSVYGGELTIEVQSGGIVSGNGGSANSGAGGHALTITAGTGINLVNNGTIRGGGGGGGIGGQGGQGVYYTTIFEPPSGNYYSQNSYSWNEPTPEQGFLIYIYFGGGFIGTVGIGATQSTHGSYTYYRGDYQGTDGLYYYYSIRRSYVAANYTSGGGGGAGGRGQGADGANAAGSPGAGGGTNAGSGGTGGTGGTYGNAGGTGATGNSGNYTGGAAGAGGGAAGRSVSGYNRVVYSGSGTLLGPTGNT